MRVRPDARRRGVGVALLAAAAEEAARLGSRSMWGRVAGGDEASLRFVLHRGFEETTRDVVVARAIQPGDGEVADGVVVLRDEHRRGAYEVVIECMPEIAIPQRAEAPPFEEWLLREEQGSAVAFVALDGQQVVGYARLLHVPAVPGRVENGLTAVRASHRRRGIATALRTRFEMTLPRRGAMGGAIARSEVALVAALPARPRDAASVPPSAARRGQGFVLRRVLKRAQLAWAAERGFRELVTTMVAGNEAMRAVTERLGYRPLDESIVVFGWPRASTMPRQLS